MKHLPLKCEELNVDTISKKADFIFTAVPHKTAMETVPFFHRKGKRVVDLSADFRIKDPAAYERWYQKHTCPALLPESVYGLPELHREEIRAAKIVGNPGCYPTGAIIGLIPLLRNGWISAENVIIDSKSGVSGAGAASGRPIGRTRTRGLVSVSLTSTTRGAAVPVSSQPCSQ